MPKSRKISTNKSTGCVLVHSFCDLPRSPKGNLATQAALQAKQHVVMPSLSLTGVGGGEGPWKESLKGCNSAPNHHNVKNYKNIPWGRSCCLFFFVAPHHNMVPCCGGYFLSADTTLAQKLTFKWNITSTIAILVGPNTQKFVFKMVANCAGCRANL